MSEKDLNKWFKDNPDGSRTHYVEDEEGNIRYTTMSKPTLNRDGMLTFKWLDRGVFPVPAMRDLQDKVLDSGNEEAIKYISEALEIVSHLRPDLEDE